MDLLNKFKSFIGFTTHIDDRNLPDRSDQCDERPDLSKHPSTEHFFDEFVDFEQFHRELDEHVDIMMKGVSSFFNSGPWFRGSFFGNFDSPAIDNYSQFGRADKQGVQGEPSAADLRDHFLKPGYDESMESEEKTDVVLDGKLNMGDIDSVLEGNKASQLFHEHKIDSRTRFFGQRVTSKTVLNPDGSVETRRTIRDNEGNEETTIKRFKGGQEYSIIKRRDINGKEEIIENLVNIDEKNANKFLTSKNEWPPFGNFFYQY